MFPIQTNSPLILASASPRRRELLAQMGIAFEVVPSPASELHEEQLTARELSMLNAWRKARAVARRLPDRLVLGADTLVALGTRVFGKPRSMEEAEGMLAELEGKSHVVVTGVCLMQLRGHREVLFAETTRVTFRALDREQIRAYLSKVHPLDKAGAYAIQEHGADLILEVAGSYSNVVGLPVDEVAMALKKW
jgi:septum formation protein